MPAAPRKHSAALPLREGRAPVRDRLIAMLFLTALLHAIVILGLTFSSGPRAGADDTPQLDVLLVTNAVAEASSNDKAAYLAQRTQQGAGNTDAALAPESPSSRGQSGGETGNDAASTRTGAPGQAVLASSGESSAVRYIGGTASTSAGSDLPQLIGQNPGEPRDGRGDGLELLLRGQPDARHWVTPDTRASRLAPYLVAWKRKVERVGTLNFPSAARNSGLSGSPVVEVEIGANGHLREARIRRSSGYGALDEAALTILKLASPFDPFPAELSEAHSRLRFAYQWDFVAGSLQSGAVTVSSDASKGP